MKASKFYKTKTPNQVMQRQNADGSVTVTIMRDNWKKPHSFKVKNLHKKDEEILEDEEVSE